MPSIQEWETVLQYFAANPNINQTLTPSGDFHHLSDQTNRTKFQEAFKLPLAGYRYYLDASLGSQGINGHYWSSSPHSASSNRARYLRLNPSSVTTDNDYFRAYGFSVRCFKDSPDAPETLTITFDENG